MLEIYFDFKIKTLFYLVGISFNKFDIVFRSTNKGIIRPDKLFRHLSMGSQTEIPQKMNQQDLALYDVKTLSQTLSEVRNNFFFQNTIIYAITWAHSQRSEKCCCQWILYPQTCRGQIFLDQENNEGRSGVRSEWNVLLLQMTNLLKPTIGMQTWVPSGMTKLSAGTCQDFVHSLAVKAKQPNLCPSQITWTLKTNNKFENK